MDFARALAKARIARQGNPEPLEFRPPTQWRKSFVRQIGAVYVNFVLIYPHLRARRFNALPIPARHRWRAVRVMTDYGTGDRKTRKERRHV
jgi:hypothetical protein